MRIEDIKTVEVRYVPRSKEEGEARTRRLQELLYRGVIRRLQEEQRLREEGKEIPPPYEPTERLVKISESPGKVIFRIEKINAINDLKTD
jgi:hypothetical protein